MSRLYSEVLVETHHSYLIYEKYLKAFQGGILELAIARHFGMEVNTVYRIVKAQRRGKSSAISSCLETMAALELEEDGILGISVSRSTRKTELMDAWERKWEIIAPTTVRDKKFNPKSSIDAVLQVLSSTPEKYVGILLCVSFLKGSDLLQLQAKLKKNLTGAQRFLVRSVHVNGIL